MKLRISHQTVYGYDEPIRNLVQSLRLTPSVFEGQKAKDWKIEVSPKLRMLYWSPLLRILKSSPHLHLR